MRDSLFVETFAAGPLGCNCTILADLEVKQAIVVDPGGDFGRIRGILDQHGLSLSAIVHTHTHIDHVGCTAELQACYGAPARIHEADRFLYDLLPVQSAMLGIEKPKTADMQGDLVDERTLLAGRLELCVLHTPGHTPGSVCFYADLGDDDRLVLSGDTLFRQSIGRTDLWGGDSDQILRSIRRRLLTLPPETQVIAGHGPGTTIAHEASHNPFTR